MPASQRILSHPLRNKATRARRRFDPVATPARFAGATEHFSVFYAAIFGEAGSRAAHALLERCESDLTSIATIFNQKLHLRFNVIVAPLSDHIDGTGGAYHHG